MNSLVLPLSAIDPGLIKLIVVAVFLILAGIGKLLTKFQEQQQAAALRRRQEANRADEADDFSNRVVQPRRDEPVQPVRAAPSDEIEDFLRRAAQSRKTGQAQPVRQPQPQPRPQTEIPVQATIVAETPVGDNIRRQVDKDLDTRAFTQRSNQLGSEVAAADKQIDERLHQVFDHHVSKLELMPGEAAAPPAVAVPLELTEQSLLDIPATFATGLTDLLADPDSVRQAIVFNEILHRPEERWV
jgi:hypothetical protein